MHTMKIQKLLGESIYPVTPVKIEKFADFNKVYEISEQNLLEAAQLISEIFAFFLYSQAHEKGVISQLKDKKISYGDALQYANDKQIDSFKERLLNVLFEKIQKESKIDVIPQLKEGIFFETLEKVKIPQGDIFPIGSSAKIEKSSDGKTFSLSIKLKQG